MYIITVLLFIIGFPVFVYLLLKNISLQKNLTKTSAEVKILSAEKENLSMIESEKKQIQEKNKKLFAMSETVYKEKKKVDEELEQIRLQKEKLEADKKKVDEKVKKLWNQSTAIHKEKERINEIKIVIEHKHQEIIDSVNYAKRIQEAILPPIEEIKQLLHDSFILFKPKDIVSGDFYWFSQQGDTLFLAACDCTGHGVPGAFMSMIGNTLLNQIVNEKRIAQPSEILTMLNEEINTSLKQTNEYSDSRDGMDVAICTINFNTNKLLYAGANRPLYIIGNDDTNNAIKQLREIRANKFAIGGFYSDVIKTFTTHTFDLQKGDCFYISTDGYADQFNANDNKLMTKRFKEILFTNHHLPMEEQGKLLETFFTDWKTSVEQTDDVLVLGVKI